MDNLLDTFLGLILGAIVTYWVYTFFRKKQSKELTTASINIAFRENKNGL